MLKFLVNSVSRALGFSKVEAQGTLVLILIIIFGIVFSRMFISSLKSSNQIESKEADDLAQWIAEVESSYEVKEEDATFDKSVYMPAKKDLLGKSKVENQKKIKTPVIKSEPQEIKASSIILLDLNTANAEELQKVKGIGPVFSNRILKFREKLGGFTSSNQLYEVYGLDDETILEIEKYFSVQSSPKNLDINNDSAKVLANHPYISFDLAWIIINYRKQNGNINSASDLKKIQAIDKETFIRLKPYLD
ncbi:MAG: helix-hairpin-helix domain-containing protein [Bacteroidota bacterium]